MDREQILDTIRKLAQSQGSYGRLYRAIMELKEDDFDAYEDAMSELEELDFKSAADLVLYIEG